MLVLQVVGLILILLYAIKLGSYALAFRKIGSVVPGRTNSPLVSLIIPFRNEKTNLPLILKDILAQDYDKEKLEVVFVNDHSDDGSMEFLMTKAQDMPYIRVLDAGESELGKKQALDKGIMKASGEYIIQSDADCRFGKDFVKTHVQHLISESATLCAGAVVYEREAGWWNGLESLEHLSLQASTIGGFLQGRPAMCSGANLSYLKSFYAEVRPELLRIPSASGDDMFLLQETKRKKERIAFIYDESGVITTKPAGSLSAFLRQRIRWGGKAKLYSDRDQQSLALIVWLGNMALTVFFVMSCFYVVSLLGGKSIDLSNMFRLLGTEGFYESFVPIASFFGFLFGLFVKGLVDYLLLSRGAKLLNSSYLMRYFLPLTLIYYFYISIVGLVSVFAGISWKGRKK